MRTVRESVDKRWKALEILEGLLRLKFNDGWAGYYSGLAHIELRAFDRARAYAKDLIE